MTWQPIATAPRDGTMIWAYVPTVWVPKGNSGRAVINAARQVQAKWVEVPTDTPARVSPKHAKYLDARHGGYWSSHFKGNVPLNGCPTHWQPLPPSPKEGE